MLVMSGNITEATAMARQVDVTEKGTVSGTLLLLLQAVKEGHWKNATRHMEAMPQHGFNAMFVPLIVRWLETGGHDSGSAIARQSDVALLREAGDFKPLMHYHFALLERAKGDSVAALEHFQETGREAFRLPYHVLQHLVLAYREYGETGALQALLEDHTGTTQGVFLSRLATLERSMDKQQSFLRITTAEEGIAEVFYTLASILQGMNAREEATAYVQLALYLNPEHSPALLLLGNIMEDTGRYDQAIILYDRISSGGLYAYKARVRAAHSEWMRGNKGKALTALKETVAQEMDALDALLIWGDLLRNTSRFEEAAAVYGRAVERVDTLKMHHWPILYARGVCHERAGAWDKAEPDFLKALELKPGQPDVLNYLGYSWLIQGQNITRAKEMIEEAMAARPQDAHIIDSMAWALYSLGEFAEALDYMEQAVALSPRDATLNDHLGDVYWRLGRKVEARFQWQRALAFKPEEEGLEEKIRQKLEQGLPEFVRPAVEKDTQDNVSALSNPATTAERPATTAQ